MNPHSICLDGSEGQRVMNVTEQSCWMQRTRRCAAGVGGRCSLSPPHSPPCPRRYGNEARTPDLTPPLVDAPPPGPSETHCGPDAPRWSG